MFENPFMRKMHAQQRAILKSRFPDLAKCSDNHYLSLHKYLLKTPHRFYSDLIYEKFLEWLKKRAGENSPAMQEYFHEHAAELNRAFLHIEEINRFDWHDNLEKFDDDYEFIRFLDHRIHPTYLRLSEAVFTPLSRILAYFSRVDRSKSIDGLDVWNIVEELKTTDLAEVGRSYNHIVRNGIAHGGVTYLQRSIRYRDKNGNEGTYGVSDIIQTFDDLLDTCNAMVLAISLFQLIYHSKGYKLLPQLLIDELIAETQSPLWEIIGCAPSQFDGLNQLIVYARPKTFDYDKVRFFSFQSGILAEKFASGYDRYFLSICSQSSLPGWAAFDGKKLRELREKGSVDIADYKGVVHDNLIFYIPNIKLPMFFIKLRDIFMVLKMSVKNSFFDIQKQIGFFDIEVREAKIHRNAWGCVLNGNIFLQSAVGSVDQNTVRSAKKEIIRRALSVARKRAGVFESSRFLPLGFARIGVFCKNYRRRKLSNFGLGKHLVCTIQIKRISRIKSLDIIGSTVEEIGAYRIAWNKAWLEEVD